MEEPPFQSSPPCSTKIPHWTGTTSTFKYLRIAVSDITLASTIIQPPLVMTERSFLVVTLIKTVSNKKSKRQGFVDF